MLPSRCYQKYKEQKLKANHNHYKCTVFLNRLLSKIQRTKVESKSQLSGSCKPLPDRCYQKYKEQKLKANHNDEAERAYFPFVVIKNTKNKS